MAVVLLTLGCSTGSSLKRAPSSTTVPALTAAPTLPAPPSPLPSLAPSAVRDASAAPIATGITTLDAVLNRLVPGKESWTPLADVASMPCDDDRPNASPPCGGVAAGTPVLAFYAAGCNPAFVTTREDAAAVVQKALENRHGGEIYGVIRGGIPTLTDDGYTMFVRVSTGNVGTDWYLSTGGRIVGIRNACGAYADATPQFGAKDADLLYGPCIFGCKMPTQTP